LAAASSLILSQQIEPHDRGSRKLLRDIHVYMLRRKEGLAERMDRRRKEGRREQEGYLRGKKLCLPLKV
jgi:hypothetical protein